MRLKVKKNFDKREAIKKRENKINLDRLKKISNICSLKNEQN